MAEELSETALRTLVARWVRTTLGELIEEDSATGESEQYAPPPSLCGTREAEPQGSFVSERRGDIA